MPVRLNSTGGGSVSLEAASTASTYTLTLPAANGTVLQSGTAVTAAQGGTGLTSPGSSGNVLTSDGTNWTSAAPASTGVNVQTFTSSGTWTKPSLAAGSRVLIQAWGGGGGCGRGSANQGGGGGGGYNERWVTLSSMGATETITIGSGGAARTTDGSGNNGGNTTVGSLISAYGGGGGGGLGGSGGGQLSAGDNGGTTATLKPGKPWFYVGNEATNGYSLYAGAGGTSTASVDGLTAGYGLDAFVHGGGGGGGGTNKIGGNSVWGGGGGSSQLAVTGGSSSFGGAGGAAGVAGTQPGGGGGGVVGATSGAGGAGQVIITVFPA